MSPNGLRPHEHSLTIVLGSSSIVDEKTHQPILSVLSLIIETACQLRKDGHRVVIVSSGAIAVGIQRMNLSKRPKHLPQIQVRLNIWLAKVSPALNSFPGPGCAGTEPLDDHVGFALRSCQPAGGTDPTHPKRHSRSNSISQRTEHHVGVAGYGGHSNCQ